MMSLRTRLLLFNPVMGSDLKCCFLHIFSKSDDALVSSVEMCNYAFKPMQMRLPILNE